MDDEWDDEWDEAYDAMQKRMDAAIQDGDPKKKVHVIYSAYPTEPQRDNLDEVAVEGKVVIASRRSQFWGGDESKDYRSGVVENPTWMTLCKFANEAIGTTNDLHHVFLEDCYLDEEITEQYHADGGEPAVRVFSLSMGS